MKSLLLPLAFCAALAGCATYVPYDQTAYAYPYYGSQAVAPYQPVYVYPYSYAYPYPYRYPYAYGSYWYPSVSFSASYWCCSGGHRHHRHHRHGSRR
jgi:hypothetical protein